MIVFGLICVIILLIVCLFIITKELYIETNKLSKELSDSYADNIQLQTLIDFYKATSLKPDADEFDYSDMNNLIKLLSVIAYEEEENNDNNDTQENN